jgi:hypothetical protein
LSTKNIFFLFFLLNTLLLKNNGIIWHGHFIHLALNKRMRYDDASIAAMAELVDALDSGSSRGNSVDVRVILAARSLVSDSKNICGQARRLNLVRHY